MKTDHDVPFLESNIIKNFFAFVFLSSKIKLVTRINGLASEIFLLLVTSWPFKEKLNFKPWVASTIMSSNFFQFTQIWHFCNGLNPNKAQMSFV